MHGGYRALVVSVYACTSARECIRDRRCGARTGWEANERERMEQSVACYDEPSALPALGVRTITTPISPPLVYLYDDHIHASRILSSLPAFVLPFRPVRLSPCPSFGMH